MPEPVLDGGSRRQRFLRELATHSAIFPVANILLEFFLEGGAAYFLEADFYAIVLAAVVQATWLTDRRLGRHKLAGNLCGPALYTAIEAALEGSRFFLAPHHLAYWIFAATFGVLQQLRAACPRGRARDALLVAESVVRSLVLFVMYAIHEVLTGEPSAATAGTFMADPSHRYIAVSVVLLGVLAGVAHASAERYLALLHEYSGRLRVYSEWFFGPALLQVALEAPERLALARRDRAILFMDIRGFTAWSERQSPEAVVALLAAYYTAAEGVFAARPPIRFKLSADEVMAVFAEAPQALEAARGLRRSCGEALAAEALAAGIGLHWGAVVEGLMGAAGVKYFDVIGDTVNTAKRIEGSAGPGEIVASTALCEAAGIDAAADRGIEAKGKSQPVAARAIGD